MKRRTFLLLSSGGTLVAGIQWSGCRKVTSLPQPLSHPQFLSAICTEQEVLEIGSAYRKKFPDEDDIDKLESLLLDSEGQSISPLALQGWLVGQVSSDFTSGKIVVVKGWVLATTEARQCAVYSITRS